MSDLLIKDGMLLEEDESASLGHSDQRGQDFGPKAKGWIFGLVRQDP